MRRRIASIAATAAATLLAATGLVTFEPIEVYAQEETPDIAGGYAPDVCEQYECYTFTALETGQSIEVPMAATRPPIPPAKMRPSPSA